MAAWSLGIPITGIIIEESMRPVERKWKTMFFEIKEDLEQKAAPELSLGRWPERCSPGDRKA